MDHHTARFFEQRAKIVQDLDQCARQITGPTPNFRQAARLVSSKKNPVIALLSVPNTPLGSRIESCAKDRIVAIVECLDIISLMLERNLRHRAYEGLRMVSRQIGRLRLVGFDDAFADEMDRQARDIGYRYVQAWSEPKELLGMEKMWNMMDGVLRTCNCSRCRG